MNTKLLLKEIKKSEPTINTILGAFVVLLTGFFIFNYLRAKTTTNEPVFEANPQIDNQTPTNLPTVHKVISGDKLWNIAVKYYGSGYNWINIAETNKISNPNIIFVDQELTIPNVSVIKPAISNPALTQTGLTIESDDYTIVRGDTLWNIAVRAYGDGYRWVGIAKNNNLKNPGIIHPGNILKIVR